MRKCDSVGPIDSFVPNQRQTLARRVLTRIPFEPQLIALMSVAATINSPIGFLSRFLAWIMKPRILRPGGASMVNKAFSSSSMSYLFRNSLYGQGVDCGTPPWPSPGSIVLHASGGAPSGRASSLWHNHAAKTTVNAAGTVNIFCKEKISIINTYVYLLYIYIYYMFILYINKFCCPDSIMTIATIVGELQRLSEYSQEKDNY